MDEKLFHLMFESPIKEALAFLISKLQGFFDLCEESNVIFYSGVTLFQGVKSAAEVSGVDETGQ